MAETLEYPFPEAPAAGETREIAPGVHWIRMPLPFALNHINLWLLDDGDDGVTLVDTGFDLPEVRDAWTAILERIGKPVRRIVVTHFHPDHLGLAAWLSGETGAPVWMTHGEFVAAHAVWHQLPGFGIPSMLAQFRSHGLDDARLAALEARGNAYRRGVPRLPERYRRLHDGDVLAGGARRWRIETGFGHSPEHASLHDEAAGILISGDMLLPRISTNVSVFAATPDDDPLARFLDSISRFKNLPHSTLVLPSHGFPFRKGGIRVEELHRHHAARCAELVAACAAPRTAGELLATLFPRELDTHQVMFAMGETIAHLNHLEALGALVRIGQANDGTIRFVHDH